MPAIGVGITITYVAWDTTNQAGKTGDAGNHTLRLVRDGIESTPSASPAETDSTNAPGLYSLVLNSVEMNAVSITLTGKSSSSGVSIIPVRLENS